MKSLPYTIGCYLAEYLIAHCIPSLSHLQSTNKVIQVTKDEANKAEELHAAWFAVTFKDFDNHEAAKDEWNADMEYRYMLKAKYLPHTLKCFVPFIDFSNNETNKQIKEGLIDTLWDWDYCEYSLDKNDIFFENGFIHDLFGTFTYVTLKLALNPPASYTGKNWPVEITK
jgi:hypothetical protein